MSFNYKTLFELTISNKLLKNDTMLHTPIFKHKHFTLYRKSIKKCLFLSVSTTLSECVQNCNKDCCRWTYSSCCI